jgi:hypothetical protein
MEERKQAEHGVSEAEKVQQMGTRYVWVQGVGMRVNQPTLWGDDGFIPWKAAYPHAEFDCRGSGKASS